MIMLEDLREQKPGIIICGSDNITGTFHFSRYIPNLLLMFQTTRYHGI